MIFYKTYKLAIANIQRFAVPFLTLGVILVLIRWTGRGQLGEQAEKLLIAIVEPTLPILFIALILFLGGLCLALLGPISDTSHEVKKRVYDHLVHRSVEITLSAIAALLWVMLPVLLFWAVAETWAFFWTGAWYMAQLLFINFAAAFFHLCSSVDTFQERKHPFLAGHIAGVLMIVGAAAVFWLLPLSPHG